MGARPAAGNDRGRVSRQRSRHQQGRVGEASHPGPPLTRLRRLRLVGSQAQPLRHSPALCTVDSSDEEPFAPVMSNSGENPTAPAQSIPTWIDMTQGVDQSASTTQVEERDLYDAPSSVHMSRGQDEAASLRRRILHTSDHWCEATQLDVVEAEVPCIPCGSRRLVLVPREAQGFNPRKVRPGE